MVKDRDAMRTELATISIEIQPWHRMSTGDVRRGVEEVARILPITQL